MSAKWEKVTDDGTDRLEVPGGWLYRCSVTLHTRAGIHSVELAMTFVRKPPEARKSITRADLEKAILGNPLAGLPMNVPTEPPEPAGRRQCAGCVHQMKPGGWPTWGCSQFAALQSPHDLQEWWDEFACSDEDAWPKCPVRTDAPF